MRNVLAALLLVMLPQSAFTARDCKNVAAVAKALANRYQRGKFTRSEMRKFLRIDLPVDAPQDLVRKKKAFQNFNELFFPEDLGIERRNDLTLKHEVVKELLDAFEIPYKEVPTILEGSKYSDFEFDVSQKKPSVQFIRQLQQIGYRLGLKSFRLNVESADGGRYSREHHAILLSDVSLRYLRTNFIEDHEVIHAHFGLLERAGTPSVHSSIIRLEKLGVGHQLKDFGAVADSFYGTTEHISFEEGPAWIRTLHSLIVDFALNYKKSPKVDVMGWLEHIESILFDTESIVGGLLLESYELVKAAAKTTTLPTAYLLQNRFLLFIDFAYKDGVTLETSFRTSSPVRKNDPDTTRAILLESYRTLRDRQSLSLLSLNGLRQYEIIRAAQQAREEGAALKLKNINDQEVQRIVADISELMEIVDPKNDPALK